MNIREFQRDLRAISDRYLQAAMECHLEINALVAAASTAAEVEPELYLAIAEAEAARINRLLTLQEENTKR